MNRLPGRSPHAALRAAFTLVELLIVIIIIAVVIAIVFPALRGARDAAKRSGTLAMFHDMGSASGQFNLDNRHPAGYFSPTEMGDTANGDRGFTAMENVMLDLAGGLVTTAQAAGVPVDPNVITVGPVANRTVRLDVTQMGTQNSGTKTYWMPDRKQLVLQNTPAPSGGNFKVTSIADHRKIPDVVDLFGQPVLAWSQDSNIAPGPNTSFALVGYDSAMPGKRASFYWNSNAGLLKSASLGKLATNQVLTSTSTPFSLLGGGNAAINLPLTMEGVLGNPAYPDHITPVPPEQRPTASRGALIFQSAGADGYFVGSTDRGGKLSAGAPTPWTVAYNHPAAQAGQQQEDAMERFDDILSKGDGSGG